MTLPLTVTVLDTDSAPKEGLNVYAFTGTTYTGYHGTTDANGLVTLTLPLGNYRFRADLNSTQFWSNSENHCQVPGCSSAAITVTKPITVTVLDEVNTPYPDLPVYAFNESTYTGYHGTTDANGQTVLTLPLGSYRFRADYPTTGAGDAVQFWSNTENHCALPGCESAAITLPGGYQYAEVTIDYTYDPLYRLAAADYDNGDYYHYAYDAVGNRLTQESQVNSLSVADTYTYDIANRLVDVDGVGYTWDANGNLLSDGVNTYAYDSANRLVEVSHQSTVSSYQYNGLGDRLSQDGAQYTLDLNTGLTQVLDDGATSYTYGLGRISQQQGTTAEYFLGDALGSVRQLVDSTGAVTLAKSYEPYGETISSAGSGVSVYQFTGEARDASGLTYLRARYLDSGAGRFITRDTWSGNPTSPMSLNLWNYSQSNPINYTDPTGHDRCFNTISSRVSFAEKYVNLSKTDFLNTYTAGGIGVQCYGTDFYKPWANPDYSGMGIAQISTIQAETEYGVNIVIGGENYGSGLRCYIRIGDRDNQICSICLTKAELDKMNESQRRLYALEPVLDQTDPTSAVILMKRRIKAVVDSCRNCTDTDKFIASSLAQNGGGLTPSGMWFLSSEGSANNPNPFRLHKTDPIAWDLYFEKRYADNGFRGWFDTYHQLLLFSSVVDKLRMKGWSVPSDLDWVGIRKLANSRTRYR